ncbi:MAG TPA: aspartate--ammonia ligase [Clostridiales bacterium]|nr:aspartate--ammonia ligase [Clostridiales bacterium]
MPKRFIIPQGYQSRLDLVETQLAIKAAKDIFEKELANALNLIRVSAPLFVRPSSGLNDNLNGVERPVQFDVKDLPEDVQVVQSLAKWKRLALYRYGIAPGHGLYTDMNAIRRDETLDSLHSIYVDQWDWELVINREDRTLDFLYTLVKKIVKALTRTQYRLCQIFPQLDEFLTDDVTFITTQELEDRYPDLQPFERECEIAKEHGTVFISQIGRPLKSGKPHDGRAPDYDDWNLNGDIIVWNPVIQQAFEISSMGIRVDENSLAEQLKMAGCEDRRELMFHKMLLEGKLPLTAGGGVGQSRICMLLLQKAHIGEVQVSEWPDDMVETCAQNGIILL